LKKQKWDYGIKILFGSKAYLELCTNMHRLQCQIVESAFGEGFTYFFSITLKLAMMNPVKSVM
jgi:hypothetical protein